MGKLDVYFYDIKSGYKEHIVVSDFNKHNTVKDLLFYIFNNIFNNVGILENYNLYTKNFRKLPTTKKLFSIKTPLVLRTKNSLL